MFDALFEAGSVSRAAERLSLSQPAVSVALSKLEADLGFKLFHRERAYFAPTSEAILLHDEVRQSILGLDRVARRAEDIRTGATGSVRIATNGAMSYNFLPNVVAEFQRDYPETFVEIRVHSSRRVASWVSARQIDIGLIDAPVPAAGMDTRLYNMECVCIMHAEDPIAALETVGPADLKDRSLIAVTGDHMVDRQLALIMSKAGLPLKQTASSYFYAIARNLVAAGNYISLIDPINGKVPHNDGVTWRPFKPAVHHKLALITSEGQPLGLAAARMKDRICGRLAEFGEPDGAAPMGKGK